MPTPITWAAEGLPCGELLVRAEARHARTPITVRVDDVVVASGRGAVSWKGGAKAWTSSVTVGDAPAREVVAQVDATIALHASDVLPDPSPIPATTPTRLAPLGVVLTTQCPLEDFTWTLRATGYGEVRGRSGPFDTHLVDASIEVPLGEVDLAVALLWHDHTVDTDARGIMVAPVCFDDDEDGLCRDRVGGDCDDFDPNVRPGRPDVLGDGLDNDCDGVVAGDADGDGFEAGERPSPTDGPSRFDCDDTNPDVFPGANEHDNGRDDDCDGVLADDEGAWRRPGEALVPRDDVTARDVARVFAGGLQVRDRAQVWSTGPLAAPAFHYGWGDLDLSNGLDAYGWITTVQRLTTAAGTPAWLVILEWGDAWATKSFTGRVGWVLVPRGPSGLTATRLDLGMSSAVMGVGTSTLVTPTVTAEGITVSKAVYRWSGDRLVR